MNNSTSPKSRLVAFLLAFFLGTLGIHRFYAGKTGSGIAMLLISFTFVGLMVTGIWALIDWLMILVGRFTDSDGQLVLEW